MERERREEEKRKKAPTFEPRGRIAACPRPCDITGKENYSDTCLNTKEVFIRDYYNRSVVAMEGDGAQLRIWKGQVGIYSRRSGRRAQ